MSNKSKTKIYEDDHFFGEYLKGTDEKKAFIEIFSRIVRGTATDKIVDLGCFDGSLTQPLIENLETVGCNVQEVVGVEPNSKPLSEFQRRSKKNININWKFIHSTLEEYLESNSDKKVNWFIASHSLYWSGKELEKTLTLMKSRADHFVIVIRDENFLHQLEKNFRPLVIDDGKTFVSSQEILQAFPSMGLSPRIQTLHSSFKIPARKENAYKQLVGFLLDLSENQISEDFLDNIQKVIGENHTLDAQMKIIWV